MTEWHKTQQLRENRLAAIHGVAPFADIPATIRGENRLRFQIVGIGDHVKTRAIIGLQPSDIKNYRTDVIKFVSATR